MSDVMAEIKFWMQVVTDSERAVFCSPDMESRIKGWVDARGLGGMIKVTATPACPNGRVFVIDHHAIDAEMNKLHGLPRAD